MADQLARQHVDPRIALERSVGELRELEVVTARQILADLAHLILHDVMVVAEPLLGRDRLRIATADGREKRVRRVESIGAVVEPGEQRTSASRVVGQAMRRASRAAKASS